MVSPKKKHVPVDFLDHVGETNGELAARYATCKSTVSGWRKEIGAVKGKGGGKIRPMPANFVSDGRGLTVTQIRARWKCTGRLAMRWIREANFEPRGQVKRPIPDDFAQMAATHARGQLRRHYRTSVEAIERWFAETGLVPIVYVPPAMPKKAASYSMPFKRMTGVIRDMPPMKLMERDGSLAGRAADYLRPRYRPVVKVEFTDAAKKYPKDHYMVGRLGVLSPDELVKLACERGFKPDEWKQVAA